jgi:hypothetical protein
VLANPRVRAMGKRRPRRPPPPDLRSSECSTHTSFATEYFTKDAKTAVRSRCSDLMVVEGRYGHTMEDGWSGMGANAND